MAKTNPLQSNSTRGPSGLYTHRTLDRHRGHRLDRNTGRHERDEPIRRSKIKTLESICRTWASCSTTSAAFAVSTLRPSKAWTHRQASGRPRVQELGS